MVKTGINLPLIRCPDSRKLQPDVMETYFDVTMIVFYILTLSFVSCAYKTLTDNQLTESNFQRISQHLLKTSFQNFAYIRRHNDMMQRLLSYTPGLQEMRQKSPWQSNKSSKCLKQKETWGKSCDLQSFLLTKRYIKTNRWASLVHGTNQSKK